VTAYIDSSALLKLYVSEPETDVAFEVIHRFRVWTTGRHTLVEVRRNLTRLLSGRDLSAARRAFSDDWGNVTVIELDGSTCEHAAKLAEQAGIKSLDALHLGAAAVAGAADGLPIITFDRRVKEAALSLGWAVLPE
jgi:predicted nucleic acid-binding protein